MNAPQAVSRYLDKGAEAILSRANSPRRLLLLDRDGVVNVDHGYVHTVHETEWVPGIFELCGAARRAGFLCVICTNQAGIARGRYSEAEFLAYTQWMHQEFARAGTPLLATYYCPHHPDEGVVAEYSRPCDCRKPGPAMMVAAMADFEIDPEDCILIGDRLSDIAAACAAGITTSVRISSGEIAKSNNMLADLFASAKVKANGVLG